MSLWESLNIEACIRTILADVQYHEPAHYFRRPFLTAYQIAIEFNRRFPNESRQIGLEVGGKDVGSRNSLAQYLSRELSRRIQAGQLHGIEGAFISNKDLREITFNNNDIIITSSLTDTQYDLSMFRLET